MKKNKECENFNEFKNELNRMVELITKDAEKFYNNENKAAGVRLRKGFKEIKTYVDTVSKESLTYKKEA